jgi:hypothetical protein
MFDYNKIPKENWGHYLHLEGIANELMHVIQQKRKEIKLELSDRVDVAIVEERASNLTSAIMVFADEIIDRCLIKSFSPNPLMIDGTRLWKGEVVEGISGNSGNFTTHTFTYDLYIRKHNELVQET